MTDIWHYGKRYRIYDDGRVCEVAYARPYAAPGQRGGFWKEVEGERMNLIQAMAAKARSMSTQDIIAELRSKEPS